MNAQLLALVSMLPTSWQPKVKGIVAFIGALAVVVVAVVPALPSWAPVVIAGLTWAGVYGLPAPGYVPPAPAQHRAD